MYYASRAFLPESDVCVWAAIERSLMHRRKLLLFYRRGGGLEAGVNDRTGYNVIRWTCSCGATLTLRRQRACSTSRSGVSWATQAIKTLTSHMKGPAHKGDRDGESESREDTDDEEVDAMATHRRGQTVSVCVL